MAHDDSIGDLAHVQYERHACPVHHSRGILDPAFRHLVSRCLRMVPNPTPPDLQPHAGLARPQDLAILAAAHRERCPWLVTFKVRHFQPRHPQVNALRPGEFLPRVRDLLAI